MASHAAKEEIAGGSGRQFSPTHTGGVRCGGDCSGESLSAHAVAWHGVASTSGVRRCSPGQPMSRKERRRSGTLHIGEARRNSSSYRVMVCAGAGPVGAAPGNKEASDYKNYVPNSSRSTTSNYW